MNQGRQIFQRIILLNPRVGDLHEVYVPLVQRVVQGLEALEEALGEDVLRLVEEDEDAVLGAETFGEHDLVDLLDLGGDVQGLLGGEPAQHRHLLAQIT